MKKLIYSLLASLFIFTFISCGSDDADLNQGITLNGKLFSVYQGTIIGVSLGDGGHTGIDLISVNKGESRNLVIDLPTFTKETISGNYSFPLKEGYLKLNEELTKYIAMNLTGEEPYSTDLREGTVDVKHNGGNNYSITVDLVMEDNKVFKGTYTGEFMVQFQNK